MNAACVDLHVVQAHDKGLGAQFEHLKMTAQGAMPDQALIELDHAVDQVVDASLVLIGYQVVQHHHSRFTGRKAFLKCQHFVAVA